MVASRSPMGIPLLGHGRSDLHWRGRRHICTLVRNRRIRTLSAISSRALLSLLQHISNRWRTIADLGGCVPTQHVLVGQHTESPPTSRNPSGNHRSIDIQCVFGKNYHGFACERINAERYREGAMTEGAFTRRVLIACRLPRPMIEKLVGRRLDEFET